MKSKKIVVIGVLAFILALGIYFIFVKKDSSAVDQYKTAIATKGSLFVTVSGSGNISVDKVAKISPSISGTVQSVAVKSGDSVKAGQTLLSVKNDQLDVSLSKAYGAYLQSKQGLEQAKNSLMQAQLNQYTILNDSKSTQDQKNVAAQQVVVAFAGVETAKQSQSSAYADYIYQGNNANQRIVTAPIDGTITSFSLNVGDTVTAGSVSTAGSTTTAVSPIVIQDLSTYKASISINEIDAPKIKVGQKVTMAFDAISGLSTTGKVERIDSIGTSTQGVVTYNVTVALDAIDARVKPQMSVSAIITTEVIENAITVPSSAIKSNNDGTKYVQEIVNNQPALPSQITVTIGVASSSETQILSGINEGASVITQIIKATSAKTTSNATSGVNIRALQGGGGGGGFRGN